MTWKAGYRHDDCGFIEYVGAHTLQHEHLYSAPSNCPECGACEAEWTKVMFKETGHFWWKDLEVNVCCTE